jgi:hypothetical protein
MNTDELMAYLEKSKSDEELLIMCQAAVDEMGSQQFMDALKPAAAEAMATYEERLKGLEDAYRLMTDDVPDRVIRIGVLAGTLLDAPLDKLDICTSISILIDWLTDARDQVSWLTTQLHQYEG